MLKTLKEIKEEGWEVLVERLGIAGATMFIMEHEEGHGDYTEERKKLFHGKTLDEIVSEIKELKSQQKH